MQNSQFDDKIVLKTILIYIHIIKKSQTNHRGREINFYELKSADAKLVFILPYATGFHFIACRTTEKKNQFAFPEQHQQQINLHVFCHNYWAICLNWLFLSLACKIFLICAF